MAAILPLRKSTSVFWSVPRVTVSTVALRMSVSGAACLCARAAHSGKLPIMAVNSSLAMNLFIFLCLFVAKINVPFCGVSLADLSA
jgi:hypothetical protein